MAKATSTLATTSPDRFTICIPFTLEQEQNVAAQWGDPKNFDNDPHDPGGATQDGITQEEYDIWRKSHGLAPRDVRQSTEAEGYAIYRHRYWLPWCPSLPEGLDLQFFDAAVNQGPEEATRILQVALGVENDGFYGPRTAAAAQRARLAKVVPHVVQAFTARRAAVYRQSKGFQYFGNDWERRAAEIGDEALKMTEAA